MECQKKANTRFDGIDRGIGERAHRSRDQTDHHGLVAGQFPCSLVGWLVFDCPFLKLLIRGKIDT